MTKRFTILFLSLLVLLSTHLKAQIPTPQPLIWGASPFQDSMWSVDTSNWSVVHRVAPSLAGFTITGITGLAQDPCNADIYAILKVSGVSGRVLAKIAIPSGACVQIGNLGDNFSTISFREDGQLFGVTGNGATVPETMYLIDKTNGNKTLAAALGAGADGEVICYNRDDDFFYHWSGNGTVVYERVMSVAPYTATNIPIIGATSGETFGALYIDNGKFLISNISSSFNRCNTAGNWTSGFGSNPDDLRGLVMSPLFELTDDTLCVGDSTFIGVFGASGIFSYIRYWDDGGEFDDSLNTSGHVGRGFTFNTPGTHIIYVTMGTGSSCNDTIAAFPIVVNALPSVNITPSPRTAFCSGDSVQLAATGGGSSQWYRNGAAIAGATTNNYFASLPGAYNMEKTNLNGCTDSSATPTIVDETTPQTVTINPASADLCPGDSLVLVGAPAGIFSQWFQDGLAIVSGTDDSLWVTVPGIYNFVSSMACGDSATTATVVSAAPLPVASFTFAPAAPQEGEVVTFTNTSTNSTSWLWTFGAGGPTSTNENPTHTFPTAGSPVVTLIATNDCGSDTTSQTLSIATAVTGALGQGSVSLYPNPSNGQFSLSLANVSAGLVEVSITDVRGAVVMNRSLSHDGGNSTLSMNLSTQPAGLYFVKVQSNGAMTTLQIIVQ